MPRALRELRKAVLPRLPAEMQMRRGGMSFSYHIDMVQLHMSESEVARDLAAGLDKVRDGAEIVVERGSHPVAVIRPPLRSDVLSQTYCGMPKRRTPPFARERLLHRMGKHQPGGHAPSVH